MDGPVEAVTQAALHSPYRVLSGENISGRFVLPTVAASVDVVVYIAVEGDGKRRVREIVSVPGRVEGDVIETETLFVWRGERLARVQGMPPRLERFQALGIDVHSLLGRTGDGRVDGRVDVEA